MIYVDDLYKTYLGKYGRMKMSHLIADSSEELISFIKLLGIDEKHIQYKGTYKEHFDICFSKRQQAILLGAIEISCKEMVHKINARK